VSIAYDAGDVNGLLNRRERRATAGDRRRDRISGSRGRRNSCGVDLDALLIEKESIDRLAGVAREDDNHVEHLVLIAPRVKIDQGAAGSHLPVADPPRGDRIASGGGKPVYRIALYGLRNAREELSGSCCNQRHR
jgi:hypothetical protein